MAILTGNGGYFVEDFECPSACQSPHSFFDSILTNYCSDEVSLLRQNLIEDVKLDKACTLMNDMLRCGRRTLQKQSFCDTDLIEVSIRGLREKLVKEFDMDMLQCSGNLLIRFRFNFRDSLSSYLRIAWKHIFKNKSKVLQEPQKFV